MRNLFKIAPLIIASVFLMGLSRCDQAEKQRKIHRLQAKLDGKAQQENELKSHQSLLVEQSEKKQVSENLLKLVRDFINFKSNNDIEATDKELLKEIIKFEQKGGSVKSQDTNKDTILHILCSAPSGIEFTNSFQKVFDSMKTSQVSTKNSDDLTALQVCTTNGHQELIDIMNKVTAIDDNDKLSTIIKTETESDKLKTYIRATRNINVNQCYKVTYKEKEIFVAPIALAAIKNKLSFIKVLIDNKAALNHLCGINEKNNSGEMAFKYSIESSLDKEDYAGITGMLNYLSEKGFEINNKDSKFGHELVLEYLQQETPDLKLIEILLVELTDPIDVKFLKHKDYLQLFEHLKKFEDLYGVILKAADISEQDLESLAVEEPSEDDGA